MDLYNIETEKEEGTRLVTKLKFEHINLTSYSKMRVDLAAQVCFIVLSAMCCYMFLQVLSEQVAHALEQTRGDEVSETIKFIRYMDKFFDCLNVTNLESGYHHKKRFQEPYFSSKDIRLKVCCMHKDMHACQDLLFFTCIL